jgi:CubicO group peptidase (beta-lactamase class C family)
MQCGIIGVTVWRRGAVLAAGFAIVAIALSLLARGSLARPSTSTEVGSVIARDIDPMAAANGAGGVAVAVRMNGRTLFFNYGLADQVEKRPITSDVLFNVGSVRKVFEATLVAEGVQRGELSLDDPVNKYVTELQGDYIRRVTIGQLVTHTSGLSLPTDHAPWPTRHYSLAGFYDALNTFTPQDGEAPGKQHIYSHRLHPAAARARAPLRQADRRIDRKRRHQAARHDIDIGARTRRRRSDNDEPGIPGAHGAGLFAIR